MTLPTGSISMSQVNTELGRSATQTISLDDSNVRSLAGVPSGSIDMNSLRGKSAFAANFNIGTLYSSSTPETGTITNTRYMTNKSTGPSYTYLWTILYSETDGCSLDSTDQADTTVIDTYVQGTSNSSASNYVELQLTVTDTINNRTGSIVKSFSMASN